MALHTVKGSNEEAKVQATTIDEAIRLAGVGLYHWLLVAATGMCSASAVFEIVSPSYLLSTAACEMDMDTTYKSILSAIVFVGMLVGTHMWGVVADTYGRLPLLRFTLLADAAVSIVASLLPNKHLFIAARFFNGFLVGAPTSSAMAYLGEFHSEETRARAMVILGLFPGAATLVVAGLAYLVLPLQLPWAMFRSWRLFVVINSMPAMLTGLSLFWFPESPRYLQSAGRPDQAIRSLQQVYATNTRRPRDEYPVTALVSPMDSSPQAKKGSKLLAIWRQTAPLLSAQYIRNTFLMCLVLFAAVCSANGVLVWMPEIFNRMSIWSELRPGVPTTACEAIDFLMLHQRNASASTSAPALARRTLSLARADVLQDCRVVLQDAMFINTAIIGVANVVIGLLGVFVVNWVGKRNLLACSMLMAGTCGLLMNFLPSSAALLGLACGLIGLTSTCISVVISVAVENYPTALRATSVSLGMLAGRCGSMTGSLVFGMLLESQCSSAFYGLGALLAVCGALSFLLPKRGIYAS